MKTYRITGNLKVRGVGGQQSGPFHIGAPDELSSYVDRVVFRDSAGRPLLPGTSLCGVMASLARASLLAAGYDNPEKRPAYIALMGSARGNGEGQASRLIVHDSRLADSSARSLVRDRNGINRQRGSADEKRLFHEEVIDGEWSFPLNMELMETGPRTPQESQRKAGGSDPDTLAYRLLLDVLCLLEAGWANIGGNSGIGYGRFRLEDCQVAVRDRCSPDQVLAYAIGRWETRDANNDAVFPPWSLQEALQSTAAITVSEDGGERPPERIRFRCVLRPLEPLLVKTGYTTEVCKNVGSQKREQEGLELHWSPETLKFAVDAGFCLDAWSRPYVPGSSLRGALRSYVERIVRTVVSDRLGEAGDRAAWGLKEAQDKGQEFGERRNYTENDVECLVSRVFGFSALGGRIRFSDAVPLDVDGFKAQQKLLDHVALDRFTGGAADQRKFNSRPYFPPAPPCELVSNGPGDGDLGCEIELYDFEPWHLGMLLLLLRDLRLGCVILGYGKNKGFGRVRLEGVEMEALSSQGGVLEAALSADTLSLGGFKTFIQCLSFNSTGYLFNEDNDRLTGIFRQAEQSMRQKMASWQPLPTGAEGGMP